MADMLRSGFCKACSLCTGSVLADKNSEERPTMTDGGHSSKFGGVHQGCDDHNLEQRRQVRQQRFARSAATETESELSFSLLWTAATKIWKWVGSSSGRKTSAMARDGGRSGDDISGQVWDGSR
ncbi:unnamed protein product [Cuscuta epithymum]|uniref:Uncharacterized protein n=1 Tax=Cuscuta epithymum TaxID=186058 RepID=A0AAV0CXJ5_9ASTE|nr:unnamed protein product [Cuscuta epithymum]